MQLRSDIDPEFETLFKYIKIEETEIFIQKPDLS